MRRSARSAAFAAVGFLLCGLSTGQSTSKKNLIEGTVLWKEDTLKNPASHPIRDAVAVAYDSSANKPLGLSEPTKDDGKFTLIVPQSIKQFRILVHQKQVRYWDYKPDDLILNKDHPHDLEEIILYDIHTLSEDGATKQVEAAELLHRFGDSSAALLMEKAAEEYVRNYPVLGCPADQPTPPASVGVSYRHSSILRSASNGEYPSSLETKRATMLLNATTALGAIRKIDAMERQYFMALGHYLDADKAIDDLESKQSGSGFSLFEPPGYCIWTYVGSQKGNNFKKSKGYGAYYLSIATPTRWGVTGNLVLYSDPTGVARYSFELQTLNSLRDASAIPDDFPLGLRR
jgi:hypothetical protein